jgi:hypothetical protein
MSWNFKVTTPYFVYDPEGEGMSYFETIEARDKFASECIEKYLCSDGWSEEVDNVVAGVVTHRAQQTNREDRPDELDEEGCDGEGVYWELDIDYMCNYRILPIRDK